MRNTLLSSLFLWVVLIGSGALQLQAHPLPLGAPERLEASDWEAMRGVVVSKGIKDAASHFEVMEHLYTTAFGAGRFPEAADPLLYDQYLLTLARLYKAAHMENSAVPISLDEVEEKLAVREAFLPTFRLFQRVGNTVFSLALRQHTIPSLDEAGGLVSLRGDQGSWNKFMIGYTWDEGGFLPQVVARGVKEIQWMPFPYGLPSPIGQRVLLIEDDRLQAASGLYLQPLTDERRSVLGEGICIKGYYGRATSRGRRTTPLSDFPDASHETMDDLGLRSYCRHGVRELFIPATNPFYAVLRSLVAEREIFLPFPQTRRDADLIYLSLLEDMVHGEEEADLAAICHQIEAPTLDQVRENPDHWLAERDLLAGIAPEAQEKALQRAQIQRLIDDIKKDMAGALTLEYEARISKSAAAKQEALIAPRRTDAAEEKVAEPSRDATVPGVRKPKVKTKGVPYKDRDVDYEGADYGGAAAAEPAEARAASRFFDSEKVLQAAQLSGRARYREVMAAIGNMRRALGGYGADFKAFIEQHSRYKKHRVFSAPGHDVSVLGVPHGRKDLTMPSSRANGLLEDMLAGFETYLSRKEK